MSEMDSLIDKLAGDARPVKPLRSPLERALAWLGTVGLVSGAVIYLFSDADELFAYSAGREEQLAVEMAAMLATGILAVIGAFFVAIPGRSRRWLLAPAAPFAAWLLLTGLGCYRELLRTGPSGVELGHSVQCLTFIISVSLPLAAPLIWLLARARPIDPLPVAVLGGLGTAALAAFILQFFHPFTVTFVDLAFHLMAIAIVVSAAALLKRRTLSPA